MLLPKAHTYESIKIITNTLNYFIELIPDSFSLSDHIKTGYSRCFQGQLKGEVIDIML